MRLTTPLLVLVAAMMPSASGAQTPADDFDLPITNGRIE